MFVDVSDRLTEIVSYGIKQHEIAILLGVRPKDVSAWRHTGRKCGTKYVTTIDKILKTLRDRGFRRIGAKKPRKRK